MRRNPALVVSAACIAAMFSQTPQAGATENGAQPTMEWKKLDTVVYKGKQDDIHFIDSEHGTYVNGAGFIYKTEDGGAHWTQSLHQPGTYFRAVGMVDDKTIVAGNIGVDYYPGVTDRNPLYISRDAGKTWTLPGIQGTPATGICAIDILRPGSGAHAPSHIVIHAAGRVGGPAFLMRSDDGGQSWLSTDVSAHIATIQDVKFLDAQHGLIFGASDPDTEKSHGKIIATHDGGKTWTSVYESARPFELVWKGSFASEKVGYATLQSYDEDKTHSMRYVLKTTDGGEHWTELPLIDDAAVREFGVGFVNETTGWVGAIANGFQTVDGGKTWTKVNMGRAVNKIRVLPKSKGHGYVAYAIGVDVYKLELDAQ